MNCKAFVGRGVAVGCLWLATIVAAAEVTASEPEVRPDNTAVNAQDRSEGAATPVDQSNSAAAIQVTANIRRAVVGDKNLSTAAHNVKIITSGNTVTLRGPVDSAAEKDRIDALARQFAGGKDVLDQLTVKGS
jgi:hyperosmotically inducible protein